MRSASRSGISYCSTPAWSVRSITGSDDHVRVRPPAPLAHLLLEQRAVAARLEPADEIVVAQRRLGEVDGQHDPLVGGDHPSPGQDLHGHLGIGEHPHGHGASYVERLLAAGIGERRRDQREHLVEVGDVLPVGADLDGADTPVGDLVEDAHVAGVERLELGDLTLLAVQLQHGRVDQAGERDRADLVRDRRHHRVEMSRDVVRLADTALGDPARAPRQQLARDDPTPDAGEPVAQLERLAHHSPACVVGHPERQAELRQRVPGEGGHAVVVLPEIVCGRRGAVEVGPLAHPHQQQLLGTIRRTTKQRDVVQHRCRGARRHPRDRHASTQAPTTDNAR